MSQYYSDIEKNIDSTQYNDSNSIPPHEFLKKYIQLPSISGNEKVAADFLISFCQESGFYIRKFISPDGDLNFAASVFPLELKKPNLIFLNHMDIVTPGDTGMWKYDPYGGNIHDDEIQGRGSWDNKGVATMQLFAILKFIQTHKTDSFPFNLTWLVVSCEETQCPGGAQYVAEHHIEELNAFAIIGEGAPGIQGLVTDEPGLPVFGISVAHKRNLWLNLEIELPISGHGSVTPIVYANQEMVKVMNRIIQHEEKIEFTDVNKSLLKALGKRTGGIPGFIMRHPGLFKCFVKPELKKKPEFLAMFKNTITITGIRSSDYTTNNIPSKVSCLIDCRLLPHTDEAEFIQRFKKVINDPTVSIQVLRNYPQHPVSNLSHPVYELLSQSIKEYYHPSEVVPLILPNTNDSGYFRAKGVHCYDVVPVILSMRHLKCLHGHNESLPLSALYRGIEVYSNFIVKLMSLDEEEKLIRKQ